LLLTFSVYSAVGILPLRVLLRFTANSLNPTRKWLRTQLYWWDPPTRSSMLARSVVESTPARGWQRKQPPTGPPLGYLMGVENLCCVSYSRSESLLWFRDSPLIEPLFNVPLLGFPLLGTQTLAYGLPMNSWYFPSVRSKPDRHSAVGPTPARSRCIQSVNRSHSLFRSLPSPQLHWWGKTPTRKQPGAQVCCWDSPHSEVRIVTLLWVLPPLGRRIQYVDGSHPTLEPFLNLQVNISESL